KGTFDWQGMRFLEEVFSNNPQPEDNWDFHYFLVWDEDKLLLATFFTTALWKEDMLAPAYVSKKVEALRQNDPYYLTSKVISMGALTTEGEHLFLDRTSEKWKEALLTTMNAVVVEQEKAKASMVVLRDFPEGDEELKEFMISQGFIKVTMPVTCI